MFATTRDLEQAVLQIATEIIPETGTMTEEMLQTTIAVILNRGFQLQFPQRREFLQTVRILKDRGTWVPVTIHFQTAENGCIDYIRIHASRFIVEGRI